MERRLHRGPGEFAPRAIPRFLIPPTLENPPGDWQFFADVSGQESQSHRNGNHQDVLDGRIEPEAGIASASKTIDGAWKT